MQAIHKPMMLFPSTAFFLCMLNLGILSRMEVASASVKKVPISVGNFVFFSPPARSGYLDLNKGATPSSLLLCQLWMQWAEPGPEPHRKLSTLGPEHMSDRRPERMSEGMSQYMSDQIECQNMCQIECQNRCQVDCQIECQNICQKEWQKECQNASLNVGIYVR